MKSKSWLIKVLLGNSLKGMAALGMLTLGATAYAAAPEMNIQAQQQTACTGTVVDDEGEPIIGATVIVKGDAQNATVTDFDGNFSLKNVKKGAVLVISYIGCTTQEVVWNGNALNVALKAETTALNEIVVTGYGGKRSRAKLTNSVSKVDNDMLTVGVHSNPAQALSGAVAGLRVVQSSGNPGATPSMVLRGGTNLDGSGAPLVMVDGQLRTSLSDINPEDIESIEMLKDAGATALYGARASNGVILVTTKTGKKGTKEVTAKARVGMNYVRFPHEFCDARDYLYWMRRAYANSYWDKSDGTRYYYAPQGNLTGKQPFGTGNDINDPGMQWNVMEYKPEYDYLLKQGWETMEDPLDSSKKLIFKNTNPADYNIRKPALTQDYNVNFSGGNDRGTYYAGFGYNHTDGLPTQSFYERYSMVFNGSYQLTDWLKSTTNFNYNRANWDSMPGSQGSEANYFGRIMTVPPTARYETEDGTPMLGPNVGDGNQNYQPEKWWRDYQSDKFTMIQKLEVKLPYDFTLTATANWYYDEQVQEAFTRDYQTNQAGTAFNRQRGSSASFDRYFSQTYNAVLAWRHEFGKHDVDAMVGTEYYNRKNRGFSASGSGAATDDFADLSYTSSDANKRSIDSWHSENRIMSYLGRVNYDYDAKYLASFVFRYDGYSSLLDNRWGFFPGISGGWVFSKEEFLKDRIPALDFGKLRASYGVNGNASGIGAYTLQGTYGNAKYNGNVGFLIGTLPNPSLRWEKSKTFEIGLDMSFFEHRLNANVTFYNRVTQDKYAAFTLPPSTGFSSITNNNGEFRNRGIEIELSGDVIKAGDFKWNSKLNMAFNKNKILKLPNNDNELNRQGGTQIYTGKKDKDGNDELIWVGGYQEGQEPGVLVAQVYMGVFQSNDEINKAYPMHQDANGNWVGGVVTCGNNNGKFQYTPERWATLTPAQQNSGVCLRPGDARWKDINGDGTIDRYDQEVQGNTLPRWTGGFVNTFTYKGFALYVQTDFAFGFKNYDYVTPWYICCGQGTYCMPTSVKDTWTPENPNAKWPQYLYADYLGAGNFSRVSTMHVYNGAYLAFREVALSYSLPKAWISPLGLNRVQFSVTAQNLGYWKSFPSAQPETSHGTGVAGGGNAYIGSGTGYPLPRTIIFGANITF